MRISSLALAAISFFPCIAQSIDKCPSTETTITDSQGRSWAICVNTDYQGWTGADQFLRGINSSNDCMTRCAAVADCGKAVFDKVNNYCHLKNKNTPLTWTKSTQYDTIRPVASIPDRQPITQCLSVENNVTDSQGRLWTICPNSDFWGNTIRIAANVNSNTDCQKLCASENGCSRAVFDKLYTSCHLKGDGQQWVSSQKQFDTVRLVSPGSTSSQIPKDWKCNGQQSVITTSDGSTWARCTNTDWQGRSIYALENFQTVESCTEACASTPICKDAVWDKQYKYCHMKDSNGGLTQADNNQFEQIRLIKKAPLVSKSVQTGGKWSDKVVFPVVPAAAYLVPQQPFANRVMAFSAGADYSFAGKFGLTQFADWNYVSGTMSKRTVQNTQHDMFCPGISSLENGQIVVTGGDDAAVTSVYDPASNQFWRAPDMKMPRGYQSSTILSNGGVFTIGGSFTGGKVTKNGEVYDPKSNTWTFLDGCKADALNTRDNDWRRDNHAWLFGWSDGSVFQAGPSGQMNWYRTSNGGSTSSAGIRNTTRDAMCGTNVMFDTGKILAAGGAPFYDNNSGVTTAQVITVPAVGQQASVQQAPDMKYPRMFANSVVLPDGTVVVTGGQKFGRGFNDVESILYPEMYNPKTNSWTVMNAPQIARNYHSVSLLLGDGTVMAAGGGLCYTWAGAADTPDNWQCDGSGQHPDAEIFYPPYLFNSDGTQATRPSITATQTTNDNNGNWVRAGGTITVTLDSSAAMTFSMVRMGSATHSINSDQRRLSVTAIQNGNKHTVKLPSDGGVLLPGYWFLFAMNNQGTPSIGRVIQVRI